MSSVADELKGELTKSEVSPVSSNTECDRPPVGQINEKKESQVRSGHVLIYFSAAYLIVY